MNKKEYKQKKMLEIIKNCINNNYNLTQTFSEISNSLNLKKGSAKNYYYSFIKQLKADEKYKDFLNLNKLNKNNFNKFKEDEIKNLVSTIDANLLLGKSVRKSCLELANNNASLMLRLQNKYRNFKKMENKSMQDKVSLNSLSKSGENIININYAKQKLNKKITDSDINALFMGLVKIVKKSAIESAEQDLKQECDEANENFRQTLVDLNKKEAELKIMQEQNRELNLKVEAQKEQICKLLQKLSSRRLKTLERKSDYKTMKLKKFDLSK